MSPTAALVALRPLVDQARAFATLEEILKTAQACEDPTAQLAKLKEEIGGATAELARINADLGQVRETHQNLLAELGRDEVKRRQEIEDGLAAARVEASNAINLARESAQSAEAEAVATKQRVAADLAADNAELARVRAILSELRAGLPA